MSSVALLGAPETEPAGSNLKMIVPISSKYVSPRAPSISELT